MYINDITIKYSYQTENMFRSYVLIQMLVNLSKEIVYVLNVRE